MVRNAVAYLCVLLVFAAGCAGNPHQHAGELIAEHNPGGQLVATTAPYQAEYELYSRPSPNGDIERLRWRKLGGGDKIGFERTKDGQLVAVAGGEQFPLTDGFYCWHATPETEHVGVSRVLYQSEEGAIKAAYLAGEAILCVLGILVMFGWGMGGGPG